MSLPQGILEEGDEVWVEEGGSKKEGELSRLIYNPDGHYRVCLRNEDLVSGEESYLVSDFSRHYDEFGIPGSDQGFLELMEDYGRRGEEVPELLEAAEQAALALDYAADEFEAEYGQPVPQMD